MICENSHKSVAQASRKTKPLWINLFNQSEQGFLGQEQSFTEEAFRCVNPRALSKYWGHSPWH